MASVEKHQEKEQELSHEHDSKTESIEEVFDTAFEKHTMSVDTFLLDVSSPVLTFSLVS